MGRGEGAFDDYIQSTILEVYVIVFIPLNFSYSFIFSTFPFVCEKNLKLYIYYVVICDTNWTTHNQCTKKKREREKKKEQYFGKAEILYKVGTPNIKTELGRLYKIQILCKLYIR